MWDIERPMPRAAGAFLEHLGRDVKMPIKVELRLARDDQVSTVLSVSYKSTLLAMLDAEIKLRRGKNDCILISHDRVKHKKK